MNLNISTRLLPVMCFMVLLGSATRAADNQPAGTIDLPSVFARTQGALAIISTPRGSGSGFVVVMDQKKYLVTNEHVLRGGSPVSARLLTGQELRFAGLEVADTLDLVRLEITGSFPDALEIRTAPFTIGTPIGVFGNSDGQGVTTSVAGRILGLGPDRIEIDAPFVQGNSGSPIMDDSGQVLGVATYAVLQADPQNWLKAGTRFNQVRRMGLRLTNIKWVKIQPQQYYIRADTLADLETCMTDMSSRIDDYTFEANKKRYRRALNLCQAIARMMAVHNEAVDAKIREIYTGQSILGKPARSKQEVNDLSRSWFMANSLSDQKQKALKTAARDLCQAIISNTKGDWMATRLSIEAKVYSAWAEDTLKQLGL